MERDLNFFFGDFVALLNTLVSDTYGPLFKKINLNRIPGPAASRKPFSMYARVWSSRGRHPRSQSSSPHP